MAIHGKGRNDDAFDELVRIAFHDDAVFARSGLALVGVATQVNRLSGVLWNETPFHPSRETCTAAAPKSGGLSGLDDCGRRQFLDDLFGSAIAPEFDIPIDICHSRVVNVLKKDQLVRHKETIVIKFENLETGGRKKRGYTFCLTVGETPASAEEKI